MSNHHSSFFGIRVRLSGLALMAAVALILAGCGRGQEQQTPAVAVAVSQPGASAALLNAAVA
jgi:hypothetical protein